MRWDTEVKCPKCREGLLEAYEAEHPRGNGIAYAFICSRCDYQGYWRTLGAERRRGVM